jgi:protein-tyrosine phosphatase
MRELDWGHPNIRDLGGLPTALSPTGLTIAGRVARGPRRELLAASGWAAAADWGLNSIVDLRNENEIGARTTDPAAAPPAHVTIAHAPTEDQTHPEFRAVCMPILDSPEYWQHNLRILPARVAATLEAIARSRPGVLVHCSAGRDRTGMVSAVLLGNAGVSADDIVADYSASVRAMAGSGTHGAPTADRQASWTPDQVEVWLAGVEPHVRDFVAGLDEALTRVGTTARARRRLRDLLTRPDA